VCIFYLRHFLVLCNFESDILLVLALKSRKYFPSINQTVFYALELCKKNWLCFPSNYVKLWKMLRGISGLFWIRINMLRNIVVGVDS
jgi:hypothetical protein